VIVHPLNFEFPFEHIAHAYEEIMNLFWGMLTVKVKSSAAATIDRIEIMGGIYLESAINL
jgi:hypothetical protein